MKIFIILLILVVAWVAYRGRAVERGETAPEISIAPSIVLGSDTIMLDIADSPSERMKGLSGTPSLAEDKGLLFIFDTPSTHGFWMKDMNYPIDMIWLDKSFTIVGLKENATPESYPESFAPSSPALYVIEVNAGISQKHGLKIGDTLPIEGLSAS